MKNNKEALKELAQYYNMRKVCELAGVSYSSFRNWSSYDAPFSDKKCVLLLEAMKAISQQEINTKRFIAFIVDLLTIPTPSIYFLNNGEMELIAGRAFRELPDLPDSSKGRTLPEKKLIILDKNKHQDNNMLLISLTHEIRHIYQFLVAYDEEFEEDESPKTRRAWRDNFKNYLDSSHEDYEDQALEVDANAFSWIIAKIVLGIDITVNCDHEKLKTAISSILENFTIDEILEVANDFGIVCKGTTG